MISGGRCQAAYLAAIYSVVPSLVAAHSTYGSASAISCMASEGFAVLRHVLYLHTCLLYDKHLQQIQPVLKFLYVPILAQGIHKVLAGCAGAMSRSMFNGTAIADHFSLLA